MNFEFTKIKTICSVLLGIIITIYFNSGSCFGACPPVSRLVRDLFFMNGWNQIGIYRTIGGWVFVLIFSAIIYTVWSLFEKNKKIKQ